MTPYRLTNQQLYSIPTLWNIIATEYSGNFKKIHATAPTAIAGAFNESTRFELHIPLGSKNNIIITAGEQHPLKVNYKFDKRLNLNLEIYTEDIIEKVSKLFGGQDIKLGMSEFDSRYLIKSDRVDLTKELLDINILEHFFTLNIHSFRITSANESELFIMPFIKEEDELKMKNLIRFTFDIIHKTLTII